MDLANREQDEIPLIIKSDRNWPRCYPIIDHSYDKIPTRFKKAIAWTGYIIWYLYSATLLFNIICSLLVLFIGPVLTGESLFNKIRYVFFSLIVFIVGVPAHFVLSYWPLYKVMQYGTLPRYILFFAGYAIPIIVTLFALVGYYDYGFGGIYVLITYWPSVIDREKPDYSVFTPMIILICFWILHIVLFVMMYLVVIFTFRKQKHTLKDVQDLAKESTRDAVSAVTSTIGQVAVESALGRR